ncbi:MAG: ATP-binding protein, partial [Bacteroidetes bacterium]
MPSPFKLLDPYAREDRDRFFGREKESAQLFNAVFASHLTLLYGASGTGKTSLVQCGLGNLLHDSDWLPLFVRRGRDLNASLTQALVQALDPENPQDRQAFAALETEEKIRMVYRDHYRPVFLIFDQFEELLILGQEAEKQRFYEDMRRLMESSLQVKVVIIIREEWIAWLNAFEKVVPKLFDNRLRIEKMSDRSLSRVVAGTLREAGVGLREPARTVGAMLENLRDPREGVDLTHLQVYLDRLYRQAAKSQQ